MINGLTYDEINAIGNFIEQMENLKDVEQEFVEIVNENFWKLV